jgi:hypothetical protein
MNIDEKYDVGYISGLVIILVIFLWYAVFDPKDTLISNGVFFAGFIIGMWILFKTWSKKWNHEINKFKEKNKPIYVSGAEDAFFVFKELLSKGKNGDKLTLQLTKVNKSPTSRIRRILPKTMVNKRYKVEKLEEPGA